jgi:hypothetical protein
MKKLVNSITMAVVAILFSASTYAGTAHVYVNTTEDGQLESITLNPTDGAFEADIFYSPKDKTLMLSFPKGTYTLDFIFNPIINVVPSNILESIGCPKDAKMMIGRYPVTPVGIFDNITIKICWSC